MKDYNEVLEDKFSGLTIELVSFDNGNTPESMQAYVLVSGLTKAMMKDKGGTALDLGNYIYRKYGIQYEMCPEYSRGGAKKNTLAFYISKERFARMPHLVDWVMRNYEHKTGKKTKHLRLALHDLRALAF